MSAEIALGPDETVPGKPFVDPVHSRLEEEALRRLLDVQRERARAWAGDSDGARKDVVVREVDPEGRRHLLVVPDTGALLAARDPTVVGFFGRPRADADIPLLFELEEELVAEMGTAAGLLSYYDVELVKGQYGNLILFATPDGPADWGRNPVHRRAVEVSPGSYHEIRLHRGTLPGRLLDGGVLRLSRTRYLDYGGPEVWRAVRSLDPLAAG
ncbi:MAG TPA: hypothetical protein VFR63_00490 [Gaiellaceae bacterium]|nr:hypothetical protein [Gaiellaceae bacterium]